MSKSDEDKTSLQVLMADTYEDPVRTNSDDAMDHLNL